MEFDTWLASPIELHSDLMGVRTTFVNDIMQKEGVSMREAVKRLKNNEDAYLDDIIIHSATWTDHLRHLEAVLGATTKPRSDHEAPDS